MWFVKKKIPQTDIEVRVAELKAAWKRCQAIAADLNRDDVLVLLEEPQQTCYDSYRTFHPKRLNIVARSRSKQIK